MDLPHDRGADVGAPVLAVLWRVSLICASYYVSYVSLFSSFLQDFVLILKVCCFLTELGLIFRETHIIERDKGGS